MAAAVVAALWLSGALGTARADVVLDWNAAAAALPIPAPPVLARVMATMHGAVHDAINAIEPRFEAYRFPVAAPAGASIDAAAASAAHDVLAALVPAQRAALDSLLAQSLAKIADERSRADGVSVGKAAADRMLAWRAKDNFDAKAEDKPGTGAGTWQRTPPGLAPGALPQLGSVTPFVLSSVDQFAAKGRPVLTSREFGRDLDELKRLGGRHSIERTAEQTAVAVFWSGNEIPQLNAVARAASQARKLSMHENARLFALLHTAVADALIVAFKIKYQDNGWRPITAIRAGHGDVAADPNWDSLLITPPHPEYPSAHCIGTGAVAQVMRELFGSDELKFSYVFPPGLGMMRSYTSLTQIEKEMEDARVFAGIHFRSTNEHSTELGRKVGAYAVANHLRPVAAPRASR
ncbi:MAG: vanadium-dependent haloperoxidase [Rubrivivax sp.]